MARLPYATTAQFEELMRQSGFPDRGRGAQAIEPNSLGEHPLSQESTATFPS